MWSRNFNSTEPLLFRSIWYISYILKTLTTYIFKELTSKSLNAGHAQLSENALLERQRALQNPNSIKQNSQPQRCFESQQSFF